MPLSRRTLANLAFLTCCATNVYALEVSSSISGGVIAAIVLCILIPIIIVIICFLWIRHRRKKRRLAARRRGVRGGGYNQGYRHGRYYQDQYGPSVPRPVYSPNRRY